MPYFAETQTLGQLIRNSCAHWDSKAAFLDPEKGAYTPISYKEYWEKVRSFAAALHSLGLVRGDKINIFSENSLEWSLSDWAAQCLGIVTVPIYPTLPPDQAQFIVQDAGTKLIICGSEDLIKKVEASGVKTILLRGTPDSLAELAKTAKISDEVLNKEIEGSKAGDLATII